VGKINFQFLRNESNHNAKQVDQDPVALGPTVVEAAKNSLEIRYSLLPYLYTLFYLAETSGDTVARPLFFEFPNDENSYGPHSESQFMWGSGFMIIPVIEEGKTKVEAYFPAGRWYPYSVHENIKPIESKGEIQTLDAPIAKVNTAIRGGTVVPILPPKVTTTLMRKENFTVLVALDSNDKAMGQLYWDDGDSIDPIEKGEYSLISFNVQNVRYISKNLNAFQ
jgi:lysosomal alpha-glucosidase